MKALGGILVLVIVVAIAAPAGSQQGAVVVRPKVLVRTDVRPPGQPPPELRSFGVTLVLNFWVEEAGEKGLAVELRCATPEYRAVLTRKTGEFSHHLEIEGVIQMLRDREILLLFEAEVGSGGQKLHNIAEIKGSAIMREGEETILLRTDETSLHATFTFEAAN